jgi:hypothetical protein
VGYFTGHIPIYIFDVGLKIFGGILSTLMVKYLTYQLTAVEPDTTNTFIIFNICVIGMKTRQDISGRTAV